MGTGLELPTAIIGVAGVIGVADIVVQRIYGTYRLIKDLKEVPDELADIRNEIAAMLNAVAALEFLNSADDDVKAIVTQSGLPEALRACEITSTDLERDIQLWTAGGEKKLKSKVQVRRNRAKIQKYRAKFVRAREFVALAQGSILLATKVKERSGSSDVDVHTPAARNNVAQIAERAKASHAQAQNEIAQLEHELRAKSEDDEEADKIEAVLEEKQDEQKVYEDIMIRTAAVARGLVQRIGNVKAGDLAVIEVGMPDSVVEKMSEQTIGDITIGDNATSRVGIFRT